MNCRRIITLISSIIWLWSLPAVRKYFSGFILLMSVTASIKYAGAMTAFEDPDVKTCDKGVQVAIENSQASIDQYLAACQRVVKHYPKFTGLIEVIYSQRAKMRRWHGDIQGAAAEFDQLMKIDRIGALRKRAKFWSDEHQYDRAISDIDEWLRTDTQKPWAYLDRARYYKERADNLFRPTDKDLAFADYTKALEFSQDDARARVFAHQGRGIILSERGDDEKALAEFNFAINANGGAEYLQFSYLFRAGYWSARGELDRALADYNEAAKIDPTKSDPFLRRGNFWRYQKGDLDQALADYNQAIALVPKGNTGYANRAGIYIERGDYDRALADLNESLRHYPRGEYAYATRGDVWRLKGDLDRSLADFDTALSLFPGSTSFLTRRGITLRYKGQTDRALADFARALEILPDSTATLVERALTYEKMGNLALARADLEKALSLPPLKYQSSRSAQETARARLAALDSGAPQPVIPAVPGKTETGSVPTKKVEAPAPVVKNAPLGRRVALVIGNSAYKNVAALPNPQRDAGTIAASLRAIGFETVTLVNDSSREKLIDALRTFGDEAEKADWAMIYYAGHGMEANGMNYLIPVDAKLATDRDVQFEAVPLDQVMASVEGAKKLKLILLDACRDNPFAPQMRRTTAPNAIAAAGSTAGATVGTRSIGRGLGEVKVTGATLVVYAAKHGQVALDGEGGNSPFAVAVVQRLATPNVEINKLFRLVRDDVMEATAGRQEPYTYGSLPGREDFFFVAK